MRKLITPIAFIMLLITGCQKYATEVSNKTFYDLKNFNTNIHFESNNNDKSKGIMIFENLTSDGHVTTKVYFNYQIKGKLIDVFYMKADIGEVPYFKQFTININNNDEVVGLETNLNGEIIYFLSKAEILRFSNIKN